MSKKDSGPVTFPEKWMKVIQQLPEFKDTADAADTDELKQIVVRCEGNIYTIEKEMSEDIKLGAARELVKDLSEPYRDAKKVQTAKIKYAMFRLEERGVDLDDRGEEDEG